MKKLPLIVSIGTLAGCSTLTPVDDPTYLKLQDLEARLIRIERVVDNQSLIQLSSTVDQLRNDTQELKGDIETLGFETEGAASRQRELYVDVDRRLSALEQNRAQVPAAPPVVVEGFQPAEGAGNAGQARPAGTDQQRYQAAFDLIQSRRYPEAAAAFGEFLVTFASSPLADNAQYWLAETYYVRRDFTTALPEFQKVIDGYPQSAKIPDALLKVGFCNYELKNFPAARRALEQVTREYPDTTAARLAAQRLERLAQETG